MILLPLEQFFATAVLVGFFLVEQLCQFGLLLPHKWILLLLLWHMSYYYLYHLFWSAAAADEVP